MVRGYKGLPLQPMASPWFLRVDLSLAFVVFGWYTTFFLRFVSGFGILFFNQLVSVVVLLEATPPGFC